VSNDLDFDGTILPNPTINLQFDGTTANLSLQGYFEGDSIDGDGVEDPGVITGELSVTFSGVIDSYHSDVLRNDTSTPTWLRTVGYQNNSANIGYTTSESTSSQLMECPSLTAIACVLVVLLCC
jgi:hypothetical protein